MLPIPSLRSFHMAEIRAAPEDPSRVTAIISTGDLARDGAIIEAKGWELEQFRRNPVVLWGHNDMEPPIAQAENVHIDDNTLVATAAFDMEDPRAVSILGKIRRGLIRATSVRWQPIKTRIDRIKDADGVEADVLVFERQSLLEFSFVPIPADPGALVVRADTGVPLDFAALLARGREIAEQRAEAAAGNARSGQERTAALLQQLGGAAKQMRALEARFGARPTIEDLTARAVAKRTGRPLDEVRRQLGV